MEAGEKEVRMAFEEVTTRNVMAAVAHTNKTRDMTRKMEQKVELMEGLLRQQDHKIEELRKLLSNLQLLMYRGGTE